MAPCVCRLYDKDAIAAAQEKENQRPLTLAELFRQTLCFIDEEVSLRCVVSVWVMSVVGMLNTQLNGVRVGHIGVVKPVRRWVWLSITD